MRTLCARPTSNTETGAPCEGSSAPRGTCPTTGSTGRRSPSSSARAAARAPARWRPTTRTPPRSPSRPGATALAAAPGCSPESLWFATAVPTYLDKTNATIVHAALRLDSSAAAYDLGGGVRSGIGALRAALASNDPTVLVTSADIRVGQPTGGDEAAGGDASAALLVGDDSAGPVIAEYLGAGSATREFLDTWRRPGRVPHPPLGGALRRDPVRPARRPGLERGPQGGRAQPRAGRRAHRRRLPQPGREGRGAQARHRRGHGRRRLLGHRRQRRHGRSRPPPGRRPRGSHARAGHRPRRARRRRRRAPAAHHRRHRRLAAGAVHRRADRRRQRRPALRQVPVLARPGHGRTAPPPRARPHVGLGRGPQLRLEVRLRRVARP